MSKQLLLPGVLTKALVRIVFSHPWGQNMPYIPLTVTTGNICKLRSGVIMLSSIDSMLSPDIGTQRLQLRVGFALSWSAGIETSGLPETHPEGSLPAWAEETCGSVLWKWQVGHEKTEAYVHIHAHTHTHVYIFFVGTFGIALHTIACIHISKYTYRRFIVYSRFSFIQKTCISTVLVWNMFIMFICVLPTACWVPYRTCMVYTIWLFMSSHSSCIWYA